MLTLSSSEQTIMSELRDGHPRAHYWFVKHFGGDKKYELMRDSLLRKCTRTHEPSMSDVVEYKDRNGNRWRIFESCKYYPESKSSFCMPISFIYYDTYGSCGAFVPFYNQLPGESSIKGCSIYTSHFFERMCERIGIEYRSSAMIAYFLDIVPQQFFQLRDDFQGGFQKIDVGLPGSIGRGIVRQKEPDTIIEIRTYLTDRQLSPKQRKETSELRKAQREISFEPYEMAIQRVRNSSMEDSIRKVARNISLTRGIPSDMSERFVEWYICVMSCICKLKLASLDNQHQIYALAEAALPIIFNSVERMGMKEASGLISSTELLYVIDLINDKYGFTNYDVQRIGEEIASFCSGSENSSLFRFGPEMNYRKELEEYSARIIEFDSKYAIKK